MITKERLEALWYTNKSNTEIRAELGVGRDRLWQLKKIYRLPHRRAESVLGDPDEATIKRMCEEFQATWSPAERDRRRVGVPRAKTLVYQRSSRGYVVAH